MDVVVHIELREAPHPKFTDLLSMGGGNGFGSGNAFGKLTNKQREHFLTHLLRYAKMLLQEAEARYDYDVDYGIDTGRIQISGIMDASYEKHEEAERELEALRRMV